MCMIFLKKIFQCVTVPIPLFQTPKKIGLLKCPLLQHRFYMICSNHNEYSIFINQNMTSLSFIQYPGGFMIMHLYNYGLYEDGTQITNMYIFRNLKDFQIHFLRFKVLCNVICQKNIKEVKVCFIHQNCTESVILTTSSQHIAIARQIYFFVRLQHS